jgi:guanosine-3',5'-bis(diphosphate) 3'-pyrophosphohydrolase
MSEFDPTARALLEAVSFAARAHHGQLRKDGRTPYVSHVYRVALIVRHVFGIDDPAVLTAAVLHDTIEDTTTDFDDVHERFGAEIAGWVAVLSKDKRLQDAPREEAYRSGLAAAPWQVKVCKLADLCDNLMDSKHLSPASRARTAARSRGYLDALDAPDLPPPAQRAFRLAEGLLAEMENAAR